MYRYFILKQYYSNHNLNFKKKSTSKIIKNNQFQEAINRNKIKLSPVFL